MSKKFILFIVEGYNDKTELEAILHTPRFTPYLEHYEPYILPKGGDITAETGAAAKNIQKKLNEILLYFRNNGVPFRNIKVQDIQEVVQIVDLDGAFIPRENIVRGPYSYFYYEDEAIKTSNVDGAIGRNKRKAEILRKLTEVQQVGNVPYSVYFASCNMDHLLFNRRNPPPAAKKSRAFEFKIACDKNPECLLESIFKRGIMAEGSYAQSWVDIQAGTESLKRRTNINLFFGDSAKHPKSGGSQ